MIIDTSTKDIDMSSYELAIELRAFAKRIRNIIIYDRVGWKLSAKKRLRTIEHLLDDTADSFIAGTNEGI